MKGKCKRGVLHIILMPLDRCYCGVIDLVFILSNIISFEKVMGDSLEASKNERRERERERERERARALCSYFSLINL